MTKKNDNRRAVLVAAAVAALGVAAVAGAATAQDAPRAAERTTVTTTDRGAPQTEHQTGIVLEGTGSVGGVTASITVYENSVHGNSVQVVLGEDLIGYDESTSAYVVDGVLHASVTVGGKKAVVSGTLTPSGRAEKLTDPIQDAGEQVVTKGTQTQLAGDIAVTYDGLTIPLELAPAFAYDLEVRTLALYGR